MTIIAAKGLDPFDDIRYELVVSYPGNSATLVVVGGGKREILWADRSWARPPMAEGDGPLWENPEGFGTSDRCFGRLNPLHAKTSKGRAS